jgi:hypothetical protein
MIFMNLFNNTLQGQNILLFNNQAGGGHKTVCEAVVQQINENKGKIIVKDAFNDILGKKISKNLYAFWNDAMKSENLNRLNIPLKLQPIGEFFAGGIAIHKVAHWLLKHDIQAVVNPQPAILHNITKGVRLANYINKYVNKNNKHILVYNILTELPTPYTTDFFMTYKRMGKHDRSVCKLVTIAPIFVEAKKSAFQKNSVSHMNNIKARFWKKYTGFQLKDVIYDELPLRKPFLEAAKMDPQSINSLKIEIKTQAALQLLKESEIVAQDTAVGVINKELVNSDIHFLMLGSQAGIGSTMSYVTNFIEMNTMARKDAKQVVYVFCGDHNPLQKNKSLFEQVCKKVKESKKKQEFPENLEIIPLEGQKADYVALILRKSKTTTTRAGGLTAMELYKVANKESQIFIHSNQENVLKGMPVWEAGNAMYLQKSKNAKVITRKTGLRLFLDAS